MPITYLQLLSGAGSPDELEKAFAILREVAGEVIWKRLYGNTDVATDMLVPFQMGSILQDSFLRAEEAMKAYGKLVSYADRAAERFKELREEDQESKRRRSGMYSP